MHHVIRARDCIVQKSFIWLRKKTFVSVCYIIEVSKDFKQSKLLCISVYMDFYSLNKLYLEIFRNYRYENLDYLYFEKYEVRMYFLNCIHFPSTMS